MSGVVKLPPELIAAIKEANQAITTAYLVRLDFKSEPIFIWSGTDGIQPSGTGDTRLDGNVFQPVVAGAVYDVGTNSYSEQGSDSFVMTLMLPSDMPEELQAASINADEYLTRDATVWRAIMAQPAGLSTPAAWVFRRIRSGAMDSLEFNSDGSQSVAKLTIESHASYISDNSHSTWSDQQRIDPNDRSQVYAASVQNGQPLNYSGSGSNPSGFSFAGAFRNALNK